LHVAPAIFTQLFNFLHFAIFLRDHYDIVLNPTSIFDRSKLSHRAMGKYGVLRQAVDDLAQTEELGRRNSNNPHIKVMLQYYRKHPCHNKSMWLEILMNLQPCSVSPSVDDRVLRGCVHHGL
jgi:hypothetical protein